MNRVEKMHDLVDRMLNIEAFSIETKKISSDFDLSLFKRVPMFIISKHAPLEWISEFNKIPKDSYALPFKEIVVATTTRCKDGVLREAYFLMKEKNNDGKRIISIDQIVDRGAEASIHLSEQSSEYDTNANLNHFFSNYLYAKSKGELGEIRDINISTRTNGRKSKKSISRLYYIGKTNNPINITGKSPKDIVWTKSWSCCGHWRKLKEGTETVGKDRNGNRNIKGMTWVKECVKGSGETINSIRVIK